MKIQPNPSKQDERVTNEGWTLRRGDNQGLMTRLTSTFGQHQNERDGPLLGSCQVMPFGNAKKSTTFSGVYTHENDPIRDVPYAQGFPHMSELLKYNVERPTGWTWHACNMAHVVAASNKVPTAASSGFSPYIPTTSVVVATDVSTPELPMVSQEHNFLGLSLGLDGKA